MTTIKHNDLWPRDAAHRFRIYAVAGDEMEVLCATPTAEGIGTALFTLHDDAKQSGRRLADSGRIGVLDVLPSRDSTDVHHFVAGDWIVLPFDRGRAPTSRIETAAREFIATMGVHHSRALGREVPSGFTHDSSEAARRLFDVLNGRPS